ncbi:MAG: biotin/lipoyl-containing protein, partial [Vulcanimicrobiaceae bacterium]
RIQVEHPVTELAYGIDLIRAQIELASGAAMRPEFKRDLSPRGWAIEVRLYAEDPSTYLPSSGTVTRWVAPEGPGIRVDSGIATGSEVGVWYDPMLAKIIAWGGSREAAIRRLSCALDELEIVGVRTNLALLQWILKDEAFTAGATSTSFLNERLPEGLPAATEAADDDAVLRVAAAALRDGASWRVGSTGIPLSLQVGERAVRLRATLIEGDRWKIAGDVEGEVMLADTESARYTFAAPPRADAGVRATSGGDGTVIAPMPGKIVAVSVKEGEAVEERTLLVVLEAMKMEHRIEAPVAGTVREIAVAPGTLVAAGERLVTIG